MKIDFRLQLTAGQYGLLLAVLIHLIVWKLFIFSIAAKPVAHKPSFVFLGSLLDSIENNLLSIERPFRYEQSSINNVTAPFNQTPETNKPRQDIKAERKNIIKTVFLESEKENVNKKNESNEILNSTKIKIQTLKLSPGIL